MQTIISSICTVLVSLTMSTNGYGLNSIEWWAATVISATVFVSLIKIANW